MLWARRSLPVLRGSLTRGHPSSSHACLLLQKHFPSIEERTVTFKYVYSFPSSLTLPGSASGSTGDVWKSSTPRDSHCLGWTWTPRCSSVMLLKFKAHCTEAQQRQLTLALQGTCSALHFTPCLCLFSLTLRFSLWWLTHNTESTYLQVVPSCVFYVTNNQPRKEWGAGMDNTELFVLL